MKTPKLVPQKWQHKASIEHNQTLREGAKQDGGKPMCGLIPPEAYLEVAKVLTFGAEKYEPNNWAKGIKYQRLVDASLRHIYAYLTGVREDEETKLHPLAHAICELMFLIAYDKRGMDSEWNDLYRRFHD